uniref:Uncharacterized protein n=1 Tax=Anopheles christyi TaxID=43041 RepID=A0A182KIQ5_9DIPT
MQQFALEHVRRNANLPIVQHSKRDADVILPSVARNGVRSCLEPWQMFNQHRQRGSTRGNVFEHVKEVHFVLENQLIVEVRTFL